MAVMRTPQEHIETLGSSIVDTLTPSDHDGNASDLKETIDYIASQLADILGETNWYDAPDNTIAALHARATLEATLAETEFRSITDITVPNGQNFKLLTVAELPTFKNKAIATTVEGLVTAQHGGTFGTTHDLAELAGDTAITPRNLLGVVDGATGDPILDASGRIVWGLLQHEATAGDGTAFTDTTPERAMVSFVVANSARTDLEAAAVAAIEDKVVNLTYARRKSLANRTPQDWMLRSAWVDIPTGSATVNLDNAIDNQGATPATQNTDIEIRIADDSEWRFETSDGGVTLVKVAPAAAGDEFELNVDTVDINVGAAGTVDVDNGVTVDSGGTAINLGVTAGQIDAGAAALTVKSTGAAVTVDGVGLTLDANTAPLVAEGTDLDADFTGLDVHLVQTANSASLATLLIAARNSGAGSADLELEADGEVYYEDSRETTRLPFTDASTGAISGVGSGSHASIAAAIADAYANGGVDLTTKFFTMGSNYAKDANVPAATLDLTAYSMDWSSTPTVFLFLQGRIIHGAGAADTGDAYPGTTAASGDVKFSYPGGVKSGWKLFSIGLKQ